MTSRKAGRERGVAVITALLLTTLAVTLVASLFWQQQVQVRSIENQRTQLQKQWVLRGALDWARLILREDARTSPAIDSLDEPWAVPLAETRLDQYVENGQADGDISDAALSGSIIDAQSRFNLGNLCDKGTIRQKEVAAFEKLLTALHLNPLLAAATADMMAAAQKTSTVAAGTEAQPMNIAQVEDLLAVPGFSAEMLRTLKDFVVVLPGFRTVNVNTASAEVLSARIANLSLPEAVAIVAIRDRVHYFRDVSDFQNQSGKQNLMLPANEVSFRTDYFLVNGKVRLNRAFLEVLALIDRTDQSKPKVNWIREN